MIDGKFLVFLTTIDDEHFEERAAARVYWTSRRKATVVFAIRAGKITVEQMRKRFGVSEEELQSWIVAIETNGIPGLRVTRYQIYRDNPLPRGYRYQSSLSTRVCHEPPGHVRLAKRAVGGL